MKNMPAPSAEPRRVEVWRAVQYIFAVATVAAITYAVSTNLRGFSDSWQRLDVHTLALSLMLATLSSAVGYFVWRQMLLALGVEMAPATAGRLFFLTQLGKYVPGAVWPAVMQANHGRRSGARPAQMIVANVLAVGMSLLTGLAMTAGLLPFSMPTALLHFWWVLVVLPLALVGLIPARRSWLPWLLSRLDETNPAPQPMPARAMWVAAAWCCLLWALMGLHTYVLFAAVGGTTSWRAVALCTAATTLGFCVGLLFLPAPAGAGAREVALAFVLSAGLSGPSVLALLVASRAVQLVADLLLAAMAGFTTLTSKSA